MSVIETRMLRWMCDNILKDQLKSKNIWNKLEVVIIKDK